MIKVRRTIESTVFDWGEVIANEGCLLRSAIKARKNAYAPYSHYKVGAAIMTKRTDDREKVYTGCNVERCSYSQTTHAEQNAIDSFVAQRDSDDERLFAVAIAAAPENFDFIIPPETKILIGTVINIEDVGVPCGHCLQIIWEHCGGNPDVKLISLSKNGLVFCTTIGNAFPMRFGPSDLNIKP